MVLLGHFNAHEGNDSEAWKDCDLEEQPAQSEPSYGFLSLDFCANQSLFITNTMFEQKDVHKCTWNQDTLAWRSSL